MSELRELYQTTILDHSKSPRNFGKIAPANRSANGFNPLCGDKVTVFLHLEDDGRIENVSFEGSGCAISMASASLMTEAVKGKTLTEAEELFRRFHDLVAGERAAADPIKMREEMGKLAVFEGVRDFPMRVKCATLVWHALHAAAAGEAKTVKTE